MTFADASATQVAIVEESTWGETPTTPSFQKLRVTGETINFQPQTQVSNELRADGAVSDVIDVGAQSGGDLPMELSFGPDSSLIFEHALRGAFAAATTGATTLSVGTTSTFTRAAGSFILDGFMPGVTITSTGFTDAANNGTFTVTAVAAQTLTIQETTLTVETGNGDETIVGTQTTLLKRGKLKKSMTIERLFDTAAGHYLRDAGMRLNGLNFAINFGQIATMGMTGFIGRGQLSSPTPIAGATYAEPNANEVLAAPDAGDVEVGGVAGTFTYTQLTLTTSNTLRAQGKLSGLELAGVGYGRFILTGALNAYFDDAALYNAFLGRAPSSVSMPITDPAGNAYRLIVPRLRWTTSTNNAGGNDSDVFTNINFQAIYDPATGTDFMIARTPLP